MDQATDALEPYVIAARFDDPNEGWIVAGALEAQGIPAYFDGWGPGYATFNLAMRRACGGFPLLAPRSKVGQVRQFLAELHPVDPAAANWMAHREAVSSIPYAAFCVLIGAYASYSVDYARRNPTRLRIAGAGFLAAFMLIPWLVVVWYWMTS